MKQDHRKIEEVDVFEEYEMIPLEPMMYGYNQMNRQQGMCFNQNFGMPMCFRQDINPNEAADPMETNMDMELDTDADADADVNVGKDVGMNQWMENGEFKDDMFMSGFNPMSMPHYDMSQIDERDGNEVDSIARRIERYNPLVFRQLSRWGMPYEQARVLVRRIVRLTLMYSED